MAKGRKNRRISQSRGSPYQFRSHDKNSNEEVNLKKQENKCSKPMDNPLDKPLNMEDFSDVTCSICLEYPHNAVLLHCSSQQKGCRSYICATGFRYSNCLTRYQEASESPLELLCPLCRGHVKSWSVDETARNVLNSKKRSCLQDKCTFVGTYRELRKHTREVHPSVKPQKVDPQLEQSWKEMELERERRDSMNLIRSMRGAIVMGDYVLELDSMDDGVATQVLPNFPLPIQDDNASGSVGLNERLRRFLQTPFHRSEQQTSARNGESVPGPVGVGSSANFRSLSERTVSGTRQQQGENNQQSGELHWGEL